MRFKGQADNHSRLTLPRSRVYLSIAFACAAAFAVAGCKNAAGVFEDQNDGGWFSKPFVAKPDWARASTGNVSLGPQGPVGPEELVSADGQCAAPAAALAQSPEANTTEAAAGGGAPSAPRAAGGRDGQPGHLRPDRRRAGAASGGAAAAVVPADPPDRLRLGPEEAEATPCAGSWV